MSNREDDLIQRPAPELVSPAVLDRMERDGWTPSEVRALIASYREVAYRRRPELSLRSWETLYHLRSACDTSSSVTAVSVEKLSALLHELGEAGYG